MNQERIYIVIGASRGLGASLVANYLKEGARVIGVSRTGEDGIENIADWKKTGRFSYVQVDIAEPTSVDIMKSIAETCGKSPICVIFNAAVIGSDVGKDGRINFDVFRKVNFTGVNALGHILEVFGDYLTSHGGMLVGISSISAWLPPAGGNKIAYPATKAYLDMLLRALRLLWWNKQVHIMTVHLGHIGENRHWFVPDYDSAAHRIVKATISNHSPERLCMSTPYCIVFSILRLFPDRFVSGFGRFAKCLLNYP